MANRRMIDKKITVSEQVANLPREAQLIFTWVIPQADDGGFLPYSLRTLRGSTVPLWDDFNQKDFDELWQKIAEQGLVREIEISGQMFWVIDKFLDNQTLRRDIQPNVIIPFKCKSKAQESWKELEKLLGRNIPLRDDTPRNVTSVNVPEEKRSKEKRSKEKRISFQPDDKRLAELLLELIRQHNPNFKQPDLDKWADVVRLMREQDNRDPRAIEYLIHWAQKDHFWCTNILSTAKLRKQFDRLAMQVKAAYNGKVTSKGKEILL